MSLFKRRSKSVLGLDISSTSVKLVELSARGDGYQLEGFAVKPLPKGAVVEKNINDVDAVAETIKQAVSQARSKVKDAAVAVAGSAVITKVINMPAGLNDEELESQITIDADQYIPFPLDEVAIDFEVLGQKDESPDLMQVLLAACRRENIELRSAVLEQADLHPKIVDIEAYAIERVLPFLVDEIESDGDQLVAIIDIGATVTTLSVLHNLQTIYSREQLFGGNNLTDEIQRRYGLSLAEAEIAKVTGGLPDDYESEVLEPFTESVLQQIARSLQFFYSSDNYHQVDHIVLAGGVANIDGLSVKVQDSLDTLVTVANPFTNMTLSSKVNASLVSESASGLIVAAGLALRSFV